MAKKKKKPDFSKPKEIKNTEEMDLEVEASEIISLPDEEENNPVKEDSEDSEIEEVVYGMAKKQYAGAPLVVIAGRPNVGKSTLFNRFMQRRLAIVDPTPGVTRDPVEGVAMFNKKPVRLVDTGGYKLQRDIGTMEAELDELVVERSIEMIEKADLVILVLEAEKITPEDEEMIHRLRKHWDKLITVVNKTEGGKNENVAWNFAQFGFEDLLFISAEHGDNIRQLYERLESRLDFSNVQLISDEPPVRVAIMGKPNTGKSTLSNRLTHSNASIVCDYAGTTRDTVEGYFEFEGKHFQVLDTAGIRRKARVHENVEYYSVNRAIKTLDRCDIVFLMIDSQEGLSEQDKKICSLAYERGRGIIFVLNKWDLNEDQSRKAEKNIKNWMNIMFGQMEYAPIVMLSALNGTGIIELLRQAVDIYGQLTHKVETAALNMALNDWLFKYPPPASKTAHFKIRYMTQKGLNPVKFLIFATRPEVVPETYITYLKNRIREDLGFDKIPVQLELKASRKKWEDRER
ncbi:MAG: ribosome biogenesis GTPase Der [Treponema sp.]|nr:ribosome biogenesis GTPase Der [Treponema sp.]